jgi:hypothetical protein
MNPRPHPTLFLARDAKLRLRIETTIERLIAFLDAMDGDENLEPSLAGFTGGLDDREDDGDDLGPPDDYD